MNQKVFCVSSSRNDSILHIDETLQQLGVEHKMFFMDSYEETHSYWTRKLSKFFCPNCARNYYQKQVIQIAEQAENYGSDIILVINPNLPREIIERLKGIAKVAMWFVDGIVGLPECDKFKGCANFVYDRESYRYLMSHEVEGEYCPVGYNEAYGLMEKQKKKMDIVFVGSPYKNRLQILEGLAEAAELYQWNLKIFAPLYKKGHFWKPWLFKLKHPVLAKFVINGVLTPQQVADVYAQSRICLNIHDTRNKGTNPRTFEIMATGSFELLDARDDYDIVDPEKDVAVYHNIEEAIENIGYYLQNDIEREKKAALGKTKVTDKRSMRMMVQQIIEKTNYMHKSSK